ncbi:class C sortase [Leucobacter chinensis]|uniref:class C sortase n=1 Tax=Leucobacter chinensis TaxID=2851010 RepID=UPI001C248EAB|nr:class C sortase [Leucobacter chinensis]
MLLSPKEYAPLATGKHRRTPRSKHSHIRRWAFSWFNTSIAVLMLGGLVLLLYPTSAAWVSQQNQSNIVFDQTRANSEKAQAEIDEAFAQAHEYNRALDSGALLEGGMNIAEGTGSSLPGVVSKHDYWNLLVPSTQGPLARLRVPSIKLDLPVYHGTSDATLLKGIGHLEGTSLPIGGEGTRSVLTGHRGLANASMFTHLDRVAEGDRFTVEVLDKVFTYEVIDIKVVAPHETEEIRAVKGADLMTLVTCTPLGINTHRILVTGERVSPTPQSDLDAAGARPDVPGFPWWIVIVVVATSAIMVWYWRAGYPPLPKESGRAKGSLSEGRRVDRPEPCRELLNHQEV